MREYRWTKETRVIYYAETHYEELDFGLKNLKYLKSVGMPFSHETIHMRGEPRDSSVYDAETNALLLIITCLRLLQP